MITSVDKFLIAILGSLVFAANNFLGWNLGIGEETVNGLVAVLTPILVYLVRNK